MVHLRPVHDSRDVAALAERISRLDTPAPANITSASSRQLAATEDGREVVWMSSRAPAFERDVLALRSAVYGRPAHACRDAFDDYSEHYVAYADGAPHYAMRATLAARGPIECEDHYPREIVSRLRDRLSSSGRLVRNPAIPGGRAHSTALIVEMWRDLLARGVRVDITSAVAELLPYHGGYGYVHLQVPTFRHPVFHTVSHTIALAADPDLPGTVPPVFSGLADRMRMSDLGVPWLPVAAPRRRAA